MSLLEPLALRLESLVYDGICAISQWSDRDGERGTRFDPLASPDEGNPGPRRR
jgi:hypothetical protein